MADNRNTDIDAVKGSLICLVILGHCLELNKAYCNISQSIYTWIYSFHMPLFIFISGFLSKKTEMEKFKKSIVFLFEIICFYSIIHFALDKQVPQNIYELLSPAWTLWYLLVLIYYKAIIQIIPNKYINLSFLILTILQSLLIGFVHWIGYPLSLSRFFVFLPYFIAGYLLKEKSDLSKIKNFPTVLSSGILLITICVSFFVNSNFDRILFGSFSYDISNTEIVSACLCRGLCYIITPILMITFSTVIIKYNICSFLGKYTLGIYLFHSIILKVIKKFIYHYQWHLNIGIIAVLMILLIIVTYKMSKHKYSQIFINPIHYFRLNIINNHK